ncbi:sulfur carrier protein [Ruminococcus sp. YE71]|uniref:sulfur carrier protein ThiS n=1 Tax=unclassified Ruminococcus TaxID=2608920 RepID=UPI0008814D4D|nr:MULTISPECIES: sulfur carrier protein ThiS [unclassified Ruminococcus]SDA16143.1 sulfur carrier protein [Ruminococcus sp. YE78]SFW24036.1 sulfur carrier protein [Ruminococcus sp. YE71]
MVKVNGQPMEAAGQTVTQLVTAQGYDPVRIAVERNEEIVPKSAYDSTVVQDGDTVEIVSFVGGG